MKKYVINKIVRDFAIPNLWINGIFYVVNSRKISGQLRFRDITPDLFIGFLLLGGLSSGIGFATMRKELRKEEVDVTHFEMSRLDRFFPKSEALRVLVLTGLTGIISASVFIIMPSLMGLDKINHLIGFIFKTTTAGFMASVIGYVVIDLSISDYQRHKVEKKSNYH